MAKPTGGLLSFDARGTIGKTAVYSNWRGRSYVRKHVVPANPRTDAQMQTRNLFTWLTQAWKTGSDAMQEGWTRAALGRPLTNRNLFAKANIKNMLTDNDLSHFTIATSAGGGNAITNAVSSSPMSGELTVTFDQWVPVNGLVFDTISLLAIRDQDPQTDTDFVWFRAHSNSPSVTTLTISDLTAGTYRWQLYADAEPDGWVSGLREVMCGASAPGSQVVS